MESQPNIASGDQSGNLSDGGRYFGVRFSDEHEGHPPAPIRVGSKPPQTSDSPETRVKIRAAWAKAVAGAKRLWASAKGDRDEMFGAGAQLAAALETLWELRTHREDDWVGVLDQAQSAVRALAEKGIEEATPDQCWKLLQLVETNLSPATKTPDDLRAAVRLVSEMGLNPYAGLGPLADS